jgi:hypothetical protein
LIVCCELVPAVPLTAIRPLTDSRLCNVSRVHGLGKLVSGTPYNVDAGLLAKAYMTHTHTHVWPGSAAVLVRSPPQQLHQSSSELQYAKS